jgi:hypothetical protein
VTTGIQCRADPRCPLPAPAETGLCRWHAKQAKATDTGPAIGTPGPARPAWRAMSGEPEKELEP